MLQKYENNLEYNIWISNIFTIPMTKFLLARYYRILYNPKNKKYIFRSISN